MWGDFDAPMGEVVQLWQGVAFDQLQDARTISWSFEALQEAVDSVCTLWTGSVLPSLQGERPWVCYIYDHLWLWDQWWSFMLPMLHQCCCFLWLGIDPQKLFEAHCWRWTTTLSQSKHPVQTLRVQFAGQWFCVLELCAFGLFLREEVNGTWKMRRSDFPRQNILGPDGIDSLAGAADYGPKTREEPLISTWSVQYIRKRECTDPKDTFFRGRCQRLPVAFLVVLRPKPGDQVICLCNTCMTI